ncbi:MAG TPA: hypothetical protein VGX48_00870 [Pyrinomonadaceae bacterium]|nr:hypothetical protein [Pyrinomonadaceae bacterium]
MDFTLLSAVTLAQAAPAPPAWPDVWTLVNVTAAVVAAVAAIVALPLALWPIYQQRRTQTVLQESFGADFYGPQTIRDATRYYVRPKCSSVDPTNEADMRLVIVAEEDLFSLIDKYLSHESPHRHLLLLADSGMGKSAFVLNYYARNQKLPPKRRRRLAVVPLGIPDALAAIEKIENKRETALFLDAFDEDTKAIQDHRGRLLELMQACAQFERVLVTCRTQFFQKDEEIPRQTGIAVIGPRKPGDSGVYEFWKIYLMPLGDKQVREFVKKRYPFTSRKKREQAMELVNKIPFLSARPMILSYIPDLLESGQKYEYAYQMYEQIVQKWIERESRWVEPEPLLKFSEELAVDLYLNRERRGFERISREELRDFMKGMNISLEEWKATGRSLLNRDGLGNLKFSHRSIMEYLFVKQFAEGRLQCADVPWTDQMFNFLWEMVQARRAAGGGILADQVYFGNSTASWSSSLTLLYADLASYKIRGELDGNPDSPSRSLILVLEICRYLCLTPHSPDVALFFYHINKLYELEDDSVTAEVTLTAEVFPHKIPTYPQPFSPDPRFIHIPRKPRPIKHDTLSDMQVFKVDPIPPFKSIKTYLALEEIADSFRHGLNKLMPRYYLPIVIERDERPVALMVVASVGLTSISESGANILFSKLSLKSLS